MSERVDWISVAVVSAWSAGVAFQASSAIYGWWTNPRVDGNEEALELQQILERERRWFNFDRIRKGAKIDGWKRCNFDSIGDSSWRPFYQLLLPPLWPKNGSDAAVDTSVLVAMKLDRPSMNGERENGYFIRRYSLIAPCVHDDIIQFVYDGWSPSFQGYISENVVAVGWQRHRPCNEIRIVLLEVKSKKYQLLEMISPGDYTDISTIFKDSIGGRLMVLYRVYGNNDNPFHLIEYEISPSESFRSPIVQQVASRKLPWLEGHWDLNPTIGRSLTFPGVFYMMDENLGNAASRVICFDRYGFHDLDDEDEWVTKFERTTLGLRMAKMETSLKESLPVQSIEGFELHRSHLFVRHLDDDFKYVKYVYFHHPLSPPSLAYLAAEAFCMANPDFDFADLKNRIGFDMFDGIFDGKKPAMINME